MDCPYCREEMFYRKDRDYHHCPKCLGEFWPGEICAEIEKYQNEREYNLNSLAAQGTALNSKPVLPPGVPVFKGGNKSGKKRKKKPKKERTFIIS